MAKKIYISPSNQHANTYATGNTNEKVQCHRIAKYCVEYLKKYGFNVMCTYNDDMYARVKESNDFGADMHVAIHTNATGTHNVTGGTQILLYSVDGEREKAGQAVYDRLAPLTPGKSAERLIAKPGFYECKVANALTVYVEAEFHDTEIGSNFIIANVKPIGEAIAKGICDYYGVKEKVETPKEETKKEEPKKETVRKTYGKDGDKIVLKSEKLYVNSTAKVASSLKSGTYYIWDNEVIGGRIRITNSKSNVGKAGQVTGWIDVSEKKDTTKKEEKKVYKKGDKIKVSKKKLYVSSTTKSSLITRTGTFYIYDGQKVNGRYRVTNKLSNCGKKPAALYVSGWMEL
jgi:N-acetylmuramoyl-L-alanine amidase